MPSRPGPRDAEADSYPSIVAELAWIAAGFAIVGTLVLGYFAANGALTDWRLATFDYNLRYSNETYEGRLSVLRYLVTFPFERARIDGIWFLGGIGALLVVPQARSNRSVLTMLAWLAAAAVSIAVNGSRSLPNYFVQANPALALAASAGLFAVLSYPCSSATGLPRSCSPGLGALAPIRPSGGFGCGRFPALLRTFATISVICAATSTATPTCDASRDRSTTRSRTSS